MSRLKGTLDSINKAIDTLDMSQAARMQRAKEQGLTADLYHGTEATDLTEFDPSLGDIGTHLGTKEQANTRLKDVRNQREGISTFSGGDEVGEGANIIPVRAKLGKTLEMPDVGMWNDSEKVLAALEDMPEFRGRLDDAWEELGYPDQYSDTQDWIASPENREMLDEINQMLKDDGYQSVKYKNMVENKYGSVAEDRPEIAAQKDVLWKEIQAIDEKSTPPRRNPPTIEEEEANPGAVLEWLDQPNDPVYSAQDKARISAIDAELKQLNQVARDDAYSHIVLDPSNIRSPHAAYDPADRKSANLLAGVGGLGTAIGTGVVASALTPQQAQASEDLGLEGDALITGDFTDRRKNRGFTKRKRDRLNFAQTGAIPSPLGLMPQSWQDKLQGGLGVAGTMASSMGEWAVETPLSGYKKMITGDPSAQVDLFDPYITQNPTAQGYLRSMGETLDPYLTAQDAQMRANADYLASQYHPAAGAAYHAAYELPVVGEAMMAADALTGNWR